MFKNTIAKYFSKAHVINNTKQYWKNAGIVIISIIIGKSFSFIWKTILARLGPQAIGSTELILSIFTILTMFSVLGFQTSTIRFMSIGMRKKNNDSTIPLILTAFKITLIISIIIAVMFMVFPNILGILFQKSLMDLHFENYVWALPSFVLIEMILAYFIGKQKTLSYAVGKYVLQPLFRVILLISFLLVKFPIHSVIPIHVIGVSILTSFVLFISIAQTVMKNFLKAVSKQSIWKFIKYTLPMSGSLILFTLYGAMDILILSHFTDIQTVGKYAVIVLIAEIPSITFAPFLNMFQSYLAFYHKNRKTGAIFTGINILLFILAGTIAGLIIYAFRNLIFQIFFTTEYMYYLPYLWILMFIRISDEAIVLPLRHFLDFYGYVRITFFVMAFVLIVKLLTGLLTVPNLGVLGILYMQGVAVFVHIILTVFFFLRFSLLKRTSS